MIRLVRRPAVAWGAAVGLALVMLAAFPGCGSGSSGDSSTATTASLPATCPETVLYTLGKVLQHVYHEGLESERTVTARRAISASAPLRRAVETGDSAGAQAAAQALVSQGRITNLLVTRAGHTLANAGGAALTPLHGTLTNAAGAPIAEYVTSVWSAEGFLAEGQGIAEGRIALRTHDHSVGGSFALPPGRLPHAGTLTRAGVTYQYASFGANEYPSGATRVYLFKTLSSTHALCGSSSEDTLVNTLQRVATLIYAGEAGARTRPQVRRVQQDPVLLRAVAARNPQATRAEVKALLTKHLVRLRVLDPSGRLLADVGGPYVLAPVRAQLREGGRTIGSFVLSIQDDEGYKRLTGRLVGLNVLMYMNIAGSATLVKNSLGPGVGGLDSVPASGSYTYRGARFRVFTLARRAFPEGPLTIRVLVPIPYS